MKLIYFLVNRRGEGLQNGGKRKSSLGPLSEWKSARLLDYNLLHFKGRSRGDIQEPNIDTYTNKRLLGRINVKNALPVCVLIW